MKLILVALKYQRIKARWDAIEKEKQSTEQAKEQGIKYMLITLENDYSPKQLLARSRYISAKKAKLMDG